MITENESGSGSVSDQERDLEARASVALDNRRDAGLEGLVGNLDAVIIATEPDHLVPAVYELLRYTGLSCGEAFFEQEVQSYVLSIPGSASVIVRSRDSLVNPFIKVNKARMTGAKPNTRLETFIFNTKSLQDLVAIQKDQGVKFITPAPVESDDYFFIQTFPSRFTGNSLGFIEWKGNDQKYIPKTGTGITPDIVKPTYRHLKNISVLDHTATRVRLRIVVPRSSNLLRSPTSIMILQSMSNHSTQLRASHVAKLMTLQWSSLQELPHSRTM